VPLAFDEPVRLDARPHGAALVRPLARALALAALGGVLVGLGRAHWLPLAVLGAVSLALGALLGLRAVLAWDRTRLVVTSARLLVVYGVVRRRTASVELGPGAPLEIDQSLVGRLLGYGTVSAGDLHVPYVPDARRLAG
jgi:hypothetical protein